MQAWIYENEMDYLEIEFLEEDEPDPQGIREYAIKYHKPECVQP